MRKTLVVALIAAASVAHTVDAATIQVHFAEGLTRGFLVVRDTRGAVVAHGDLIQTVQGGEIDKRMTLRFKDGSVLDEKVTFTQEGVFALKTYQLSEKGPTFGTGTEIALDAGTGAYRVSRQDREGGQAKVDTGTIDPPADVYNGMLIVIAKDLPHDSAVRVHFVAFTPQPRLIEIEFEPLAERDKVKIGDLTKGALHYVMKPKLGPLLRFFATILRRSPPDNHVWILHDVIPTFVAFQGMVGTTDDVWTIEAISPTRGSELRSE